MVSSGNVGGGSNRGWRVQLIPDFDNNRLFVWEVSSNKLLDEVSLEDYSRKSTRIQYTGGLNISIESAFYIDFDSSNNRFFTIATRLGGLLTFDPLTYDFSFVSKMYLSEGRSFGSPRDIELDLVNDRYFVADYTRKTVWQVDAADGNRTALINSSSIDRNNPLAIAYSKNRNDIAITTMGVETVSLHNLEDNTTQILSGDGVGVGPAFDSISDVAFDEANNQLVVNDAGTSSVIAVDLDSGHRSIITDDSTVSGNLLNLIPGIYLNQDKFLIAGSLALKSAVYQVDMVTGNKIELASVNGYPSSWVYDDQDNKAYFLFYDYVLSVDLHTGLSETVYSAPLAGDTDLESGRLAWDEETGNLYLSLWSRQMVVIDPLSGGRLMISK
jgi:hypothetical protein